MTIDVRRDFMRAASRSTSALQLRRERTNGPIQQIKMSSGRLGAGAGIVGSNVDRLLESRTVTETPRERRNAATSGARTYLRSKSRMNHWPIARRNHECRRQESIPVAKN